MSYYMLWDGQTCILIEHSTARQDLKTNCCFSCLAVCVFSSDAQLEGSVGTFSGQPCLVYATNALSAFVMGVTTVSSNNVERQLHSSLSLELETRTGDSVRELMCLQEGQFNM